MLLEEWHVSVEVPDGLLEVAVDRIVAVVELELRWCAARIEAATPAVVAVER